MHGGMHWSFSGGRGWRVMNRRSIQNPITIGYFHWILVPSSLCCRSVRSRSTASIVRENAVQWSGRLRCDRRTDQTFFLSLLRFLKVPKKISPSQPEFSLVTTIDFLGKMDDAVSKQTSGMLYRKRPKILPPGSLRILLDWSLCRVPLTAPRSSREVPAHAS